jgi:hypothetical protein
MNHIRHTILHATIEQPDERRMVKLDECRDPD